MRHSTFFAGLLLGAATLTPASVWANTDCGNPPVKTAEVVYLSSQPLRRQSLRHRLLRVLKRFKQQKLLHPQQTRQHLLLKPS